MTRRSTLMSRVPPTRRNTRSCRTRRNFAWLLNDISLTSSRKSVPRSASSISPFLADFASVNAPFSWPNSSLSKSELFGHEKGAFTDAKSAKKGLMELADRRSEEQTYELQPHHQ